MSRPFARRVPMGTPTAVVSGLGPNGVLAALELLRAGYHVTVVEKRPAYIRPIHLHLRASYLEDVKRLSPKLHSKLTGIATTIEAMERVRLPQSGPPQIVAAGWPAPYKAASREDLAIRERLTQSPVAHVRLDSLEKLFYAHLNGLTGLQYGLDPAPLLEVCRGYALDLQPEGGRFRAVIRPSDPDEPDAPETEDLGFPDLVVLAEGGKSAGARNLGLETIRFSYAKYFMSAHVDIPFGPRTRRIDTDVRQLLRAPHLAPEPISLWACGHADPAQGTWIVLEVPAGFVEKSPDTALDYFVEGTCLLLGGESAQKSRDVRTAIRRSVENGTLLANMRKCGNAAPDAGGGTPFAGTFKFEQQCLRRPAAGANVIVLGDSAGMGHHALSSGLEMGACDLGPLRRLAAELARGDDGATAVARYAESVFRSRVTLLALGMREYYPQLDFDPVDLMHRAADVADARGMVAACEAFEAFVAGAVQPAEPKTRARRRAA
jgi:hypothetical protein